MSLSDLAFRVFFKGCGMSFKAEMHGMPVPGIKKSPRVPGTFREKQEYVV